MNFSKKIILMLSLTTPMGSYTQENLEDKKAVLYAIHTLLVMIKREGEMITKNNHSSLTNTMIPVIKHTTGSLQKILDKNIPQFPELKVFQNELNYYLDSLRNFHIPLPTDETTHNCHSLIKPFKLLRFYPFSAFLGVYIGAGIGQCVASFIHYKGKEWLKRHSKVSNIIRPGCMITGALASALVCVYYMNKWECTAHASHETLVRSIFP